MGIVAAYLLNVSAGLILITSLVLAVLSYVFRDRIVATLLVVAVFFGLGAFALHLEKTSPIENRVKFLYDSGRLSSGEPIEIEGKLIRPPEPVPEGYFLLINSYSARSKSLEQTVSGVVRIFVPLQGLEAHGDFERLSLSYGSQIRVACLLEREDRFLNPGVISRKHLLDSQRIDATANLKSPLLIEKIGDGRNVDRAVGAVLEVRVNAIVRIRELFTKETAGVLIASLLGNKYFLDKKTADIFREGGTFHVLVISGLHITFIGGLILLLARRFTSRRWVQALTTLSVLWFYGLAVGGDAFCQSTNSSAHISLDRSSL